MNTKYQMKNLDKQIFNFEFDKWTTNIKAYLRLNWIYKYIESNVKKTII